MQNHLKDQTSPYLLQHADNPVYWYPWCEEAFERAKREDKPVFLSIGYSTCHWCHVMAHESFEDEEIADILNRYFISVKVDKEERPDIDSIYMSVCQALTGSGGWPTTIFLTPDQKPFFAGTYFPKTAGFGQIGLQELLLAIQERWKTDREDLLKSADEILSFLSMENLREEHELYGTVNEQLIHHAVEYYKRIFDKEYGGFGRVPKFPTPHNLLFLMRYYEKYEDKSAMEMVEKTLIQMHRGGIFDHIGGGFCRYSTDRFFLAPHFEKMLYDNALLIMAYCKAYEITGKSIYREIAENTATYILGEMTSEDGGFYSAQDADSEGVEGKYYLFEPSEIMEVLGEQGGKEFNRYFDITEKGNFEGKNIPNLLKSDSENENMNAYLPAIYEYRRKRYALHLDDKILTSWNGLMIAAMCGLYRISGNNTYLTVAKEAQKFIESNLCERDTLYVSYRNGHRNQKGFLDDYANEILALISLYGATYENKYLKKAEQFCEKVFRDFDDEKQGGFFLYGRDNEELVLRPKEYYDGAVPSGNSMMAYNLVKLFLLTGEMKYKDLSEQQLSYMSMESSEHPAGSSMFLTALADYMKPPKKITAVVKNMKGITGLPLKTSLDTIVRVIEEATEEYTLINEQTTYYVCEGHTCYPPVNQLENKEELTENERENF